MSGGRPATERQRGPGLAVHAVMMGLARGLALVGGAILSGLILMTCVSILGRHASNALNSGAASSIAPDLASWLLGLGIGPIFGDFELIELGMGFAIFAFLPLCQITAGHARVDIFTSYLGRRANRWLLVVTDLLFAAALALIAWRLSLGMQSRLRTGQTTFLLEWPVWWPYAACVAAASVAVLISVYMVIIRLIEALRDTDLIGEDAP